MQVTLAADEGGQVVVTQSLALYAVVQVWSADLAGGVPIGVDRGGLAPEGVVAVGGLVAVGVDLLGEIGRAVVGEGGGEGVVGVGSGVAARRGDAKAQPENQVSFRNALTQLESRVREVGSSRERGMFLLGQSRSE